MIKTGTRVAFFYHPFLSCQNPINSIGTWMDVIDSVTSKGGGLTNFGQHRQSNVLCRYRSKSRIRLSTTYAELILHSVEESLFFLFLIIFPFIL